MGQWPLTVQEEWELTSRRRSKSHGPIEARLSRNVWPRYVLGIVPRPGSDVVSQIPPETSRIPRSCAEFPTRHRSFDAGYESAQEGRNQDINSGKFSNAI